MQNTYHIILKLPFLSHEPQNIAKQKRPWLALLLFTFSFRRSGMARMGGEKRETDTLPTYLPAYLPTSSAGAVKIQAHSRIIFTCTDLDRSESGNISFESFPEELREFKVPSPALSFVFSLLPLHLCSKYGDHGMGTR